MLSSTQAYSPPSSQYIFKLSSSDQNNPSLSTSNQGVFLKKKPTYEPSNVMNGSNSPTYSGPRRNSAQIRENEPEYMQNPNAKRIILKQHAEATRGFHIAVDLIKANDNNAVLFAYLILKKAEQKLAAIRDEIANSPEYKEIVVCFNSELKEIIQQLSKYNLS